MDDPDRLVHQTGSSLEKGLLQAGRRYHGPDGLHARTLDALGLGSAALVGGALAWLASRTLGAKVVLAFSTLTVLVAVPISYLTLRRSPQPTSQISDLSPAAQQVPVTTPIVATPAETAPAAAEDETDSAASPPRTPARSRARAMRTSSALRAEVAALDAVRSALANHDARGALSFLEAYFRTYPQGRLRLEAEVLRIDALAKNRQLDQARRYARDFLKDHPSSVLTPRVRAYARP